MSTTQSRGVARDAASTRERRASDTQREKPKTDWLTVSLYVIMFVCFALIVSALFFII